MNARYVVIMLILTSYTSQNYAWTFAGVVEKVKNKLSSSFSRSKSVDDRFAQELESKIVQTKNKIKDLDSQEAQVRDYLNMLERRGASSTDVDNQTTKLNNIMTQRIAAQNNLSRDIQTIFSLERSSLNQMIDRQIPNELRSIAKPSRIYNLKHWDKVYGQSVAKRLVDIKFYNDELAAISKLATWSSEDLKKRNEIEKKLRDLRINNAREIVLKKTLSPEDKQFVASVLRDLDRERQELMAKRNALDATEKRYLDQVKVPAKPSLPAYETTPYVAPKAKPAEQPRMEEQPKTSLQEEWLKAGE